MLTIHSRRTRHRHFTAMSTGLVPPILSALGTSAPALRTAILERRERAS